MAPQYAHVELYRNFDDLGVIRKRWTREVQPGDPAMSAAYTRNPIAISHGRGPEQGEPTPSSATATLAGWDYNPENPASPLYGWIGRNTPVRIQAGDRPALVDDFARTRVDTWGARTWYAFDASVEGWVGEGPTSVAHVTSPTHDGAGALSATETMGAGFAALRFNDAGQIPDNISASGTTVAMWVLVPAGAPGTGWQGRLEVQDSAFVWQPGPTVALTPGVWTRLTFTPGGGLLANCRAIGVEIGATGVNATQTVYIDTVQQYTSDDELPWYLTGGTTADFDVNGSEATQTHPAVNSLHASYVDTGAVDHRVRAVWDWSAADITGGPAVITVRGRATDGSNYYALNVEYSTAEQLTIALVKRVNGAGALLAISSVSINLLGLATADMMGELYIEGNRIYGSAWRRLADADEPLVWQLEAEDDDLTGGTLAGWGSVRATGNTNANLQARLHHFTAVPGTLRFAGEVADWRPRRDRQPDGDRWVEVEAGDPLLRLQAPQADALRSALSREIERSSPVAYWRFDDGADALSAASALPGGSPMAISATNWDTFVSEAVDWEPVSYVPWLEPMATPAAGLRLTAIGDVPMNPAAMAWSVDFTFRVAPDSDPVEGGVAYQVTGTGVPNSDTNPRVDWQLIFEQGTYTLLHRTQTVTPAVIFVSDGPLVVATGAIFHARLKTERVGGNVEWELLVNNATIDSGTLVGQGWNPLSSAGAVFGANSANGFAGLVALSHFAVWDHLSPPANAANAAVVGRSGELVGDRLTRLFAEEGIAFELVGDAADTEPAGPQLLDTLAANAAACEAVDMGWLYGSRHQVGVSYRTRVSLYNQTPVVFDVDGEDLVPPLEPVIGALGVVNDVTVKRDRGSSAVSIAESGPLNVNPPHLDPDGVGRYPVEHTLNCDLDGQLQGLADWRRYRGTVKAVRYPQVAVNVGALVADGKAALAAAVDRLRIGDRVDLDNAEPTGVLQLVPGYTETLGGAAVERVLTLNGTPAQLYEVGVYDAPGHKYDSAYSTTAASFIAGTNVTLSVAVEAGRVLWVTGAGAPQFPIDINVAGCRLRVTAIAGAASPQTFTVDVAVVNGISKTIPAGTPVRLWAPRRYGL